MRKTKNQAERIERSLTGKQEHFSEWKERGHPEVWDGAHNEKHEDRAEAMTGLFKWGPCECVEGTRIFNLHQPYPGNTRNHHCAQILVEAAHL